MATFAIYGIKHLPSGLTYVGKTRADRLEVTNTVYGPMQHRFMEHLYSMTRGDHYSKTLQATWDGDASHYEFTILELITARNSKSAPDAEREWIQSLGYMCLNDRGTGRPSNYSVVHKYPNEIRDEVIRRLSEGQTGRSIANELGVSTAWVCNLRKEAGGAPIKELNLNKLHAKFDAIGTDFKMYGDEISITGTLTKHGITRNASQKYKAYLTAKGLI